MLSSLNAIKLEEKDRRAEVEGLRSITAEENVR